MNQNKPVDGGKAAGRERLVEIAAADLPLHCPTPSQQLWNTHPRVFLPIEQTGEALCPYCGTRYLLRGTVKAGH
jgi:uncharacterized Zn-finger protein